MSFTHPFSRFGLAYVMYEEKVDSVEKVTKEMLIKHLAIGLSRYRMRSRNNPKIDDILKFEYISFNEMVNEKINALKKMPEEGIYLCPNALTTDYKSSSTWDSLTKLHDSLKSIDPQKLFTERQDLTIGLAPISGKFNNGKKSQSYPKSSIFELTCCAITATTPNKPCLAYKETGKSGTSYISTAIIPDLPLIHLISFIELFNKMLTSQLKEDVLSKKVLRDKAQNDNKKEVVAKFSRPKIFDGNFPNAPKSFAMGAIGLLGAIGKWAEEAEETQWAGEVLDLLKETPIYLIRYGDATSITFNHYVVDLAKKNRLSAIVNAIYHSEIIADGKRPSKIQDESKTKYPLYDMFASRFLQLFDRASFKDFISIRAEYESELLELLILYFEKIMNIKPEIVSSAKELGLWLNYVAYKIAKEESEEKSFDDFKKIKSKILIELESSAFSAKSPTALLSQTLTRAGRLSGMDAPANADIFMQAVASGEINLDDAKNLITAFSRLRNKWEPESKDDIQMDSDSTQVSKEEQV